MRYLSIALLTTLLSTTALAATPGVTVIDREMIESYRFTSIAHALETLAGIDVLRTYFKQNLVTARGILQEHYANKILFMIDGAPAWNAITGEPIIDRININDVERIEVTKGPASVEHGTNAYVAAINIILRTDTPKSYEVRLGAGTESWLTAGGSSTLDLGGAQLFIAANSQKDDGRDRTMLDERGQHPIWRDYQKGDDVTLRLHSQRHTFLVNATSRTESFLGNTPELAGGLGQDLRTKGLLASYEFFLPAGPVEWRYRVEYDHSIRNFSRSGNGLTRSNVDGWRVMNDLTALWKVNPSLKLESGVERESHHSIEYTNYDVPSGRVLENNQMRDRSISDWALYGRGTWEHNVWRIGGGARYTDSQVVGSNVSADARLEYNLSPANRFALLAGESYRAPSIFELYFRTSTNTVYGNTDLKPETNTTYQLVYQHSSGNLETQATIYHASYADKIFRTRRLPDDPVDRSLIYINGDPFSADGLELELRSKCAGGSTFLSYTFVNGTSGDAVPGTNHYNFRYVPQHAVNAGVSRSIGPWSLATVGTWRSSTQGPLADIGSRSSVDFDLAYTTHAGPLRLRHSLVVSNAFDDLNEIPEYVRRNINAIPSGVGRRVIYMLEIRPR